MSFNQANFQKLASEIKQADDIDDSIKRDVECTCKSYNILRYVLILMKAGKLQSEFLKQDSDKLYKMQTSDVLYFALTLLERALDITTNDNHEFVIDGETLLEMRHDNIGSYVRDVEDDFQLLEHMARFDEKFNAGDKNGF